MSQIKRWFGVLWILAGLALAILLFRIAIHEMTSKPQIDTQIQWIVFLIVFLPIIAGLVIFGYYAMKGEYDHI
ncbi:MAG TPA: hypothetical protein PLQ32_08810 [Flavihumibacter sp.]|nr:hypothetical protein [Bacteroidota bacterium]HOA37592.1 hypothetical protein [Flavihumibacter sp.]HPZ88189.1 hypothetical protein [Flavihumibacter sp.]HQD10509.1 hypothetical protein [Flavihumibacter sp.]